MKNLNVLFLLGVLVFMSAIAGAMTPGLNHVAIVHADACWEGPGMEASTTGIHMRLKDDDTEIEVSASDVKYKIVSAVNYDKAWGVDEEDKIYRTEDGGKTWKPVGNEKARLSTISAVDYDEAWGVNAANIIYRTEDGGENWEPVEKEGGLATVSALKDNKAWGIDKEGKIYKTENGGKTWKPVGNEKARLSMISAVDYNTAWGVNAADLIYRTEDGGNTWSAVAKGGAKLAMVSAVNYETAWGVNAADLIYRTRDGGNTWDAVEKECELAMVSAVNYETAWGVDKEGNIYRTDDGGITWNQVSFNSNAPSKVMLDGKRWMTQNLNIEIPDSWCYDDDPVNCAKYGRLYTWEAAKEACAALCDGWRLPTDEEWLAMIMNYGGVVNRDGSGREAAYGALIDGGKSEYNALLGGFLTHDGHYDGLGTYGYYWTSTEGGRSGYAWYYEFFSGKLTRYDYFQKYGRSVRCIKDTEQTDAIAQKTETGQEQEAEPEQATEEEAEQTIVDPAGISYPIKRMKDGKRWMTQNLNYEVPDSYCYDDDSKNCETYGRLYPWEAAKQACAELGDGWRLPTDEEWQSLRDSYGNTGEASYEALIEGGDSGFNALLGGTGTTNGTFGLLGALGLYWSGTEKDAQDAWYYYFRSLNGELGLDSYDKAQGYSCRCLKDEN